MPDLTATLPFPPGSLLLAPLAGYTDSPFRQMAAAHGAAMTFTELLSVEAISRSCAKTARMMHFEPGERPLAIQLFGKSPEQFAMAARNASALQPDGLDINCGCCAQKVCYHGSGAALLKDTLLLRNIAEQTVLASSVPVSAKIRLGWDFNTKNWAQVISALADAGITFVTVHGRTRSQQYTGEADWHTIAEIAAFSPLPVIGNGDITSHEMALSRLRESGCHSVMIGRGALGNPWIFSDHTPTVDEIADEILVHARLMDDFYGVYGMILMRKHLARYIHGVRGAATLRGRLVKIETLDDLLPLLDELREAGHANEPVQ